MWLYTFKSQFINATQKKKKVGHQVKGVIVRYYKRGLMYL
jgi:hypothetical protein